ncbi:MAG: RNA pseudouridine synthase [Gammaproteobacteria bacterium]|nr:RNA pseudouridine synthase [Gammaproteobacteria bacterium]
MARFIDDFESLIIKQTDDWLVINKPAGHTLHNEAGDGFIFSLKAKLNLPFLAPAHRLDKVTSGCLLLAKNSQSAAHLSKQFQDQSVGKIYLAITKGKPKKKQGLISGDMSQGRNGNWRLEHSKQQPAITEFYSIGFQEGLRVAIVKPVTGKTHQIRVALKSNGSPILGDQRYATISSNSIDIDRCYLHCWQLAFKDMNGNRLEVSSKPESGELFLTEKFWSIVNSKAKSLTWRN